MAEEHDRAGKVWGQGELFGEVPAKKKRNVKPKLFTPEQDQVIRAEYEAGSNTVLLATKYGCSDPSIANAIRRAGGQVKSRLEASRITIQKASAARILFNDSQKDEIVSQYQGGDSLDTLAERWGCCPFTIGYVLEQRGIDRRLSYARRCTLDESVFDDIENSPLAAYFAGLLFADGCIHEGKDRGEAAIVLGMNHEVGSFLVTAFRDFLKSSHKLVVSQAQPSKLCPRPTESITTKLHVRSDRLAAALARYGIVPRKSLTATVHPAMILNAHWWRGVCDGDGYLTHTPQGAPVIGVCSSKHTCDSFRTFCQSVTETEQQPNSVGKIWHFKVNNYKAAAVAAALYDNEYLAHPEKKQLAMEAIEWRRTRKPRFCWKDLTVEMLDKLYTELGTWDAVAARLGVRRTDLSSRRKKLYGPAFVDGRATRWQN